MQCGRMVALSGLMSALISLCALAATNGGRSEIVDVNDMGPHEQGGVTEFWDCSKHHCRVVRAWSAVTDSMSVGETVSAMSKAGFELETRSFVREISEEFDFTTESGLLLIIR